MTSTFGPDFSAKLDSQRIMDQHKRIRTFMLEKSKSGEWVSLEDIEFALGYPQASISAQLRHLRKPLFGGYIVNKKRVGNYWEYMVLLPEKPKEPAVNERDLYINTEWLNYKTKENL